MLSIRNILFATDFSERSRYAFGLAVSLARDYGAKLLIAHVIEPVFQGGELGMTPLWPEGAPADILRRLREDHPVDPNVPVDYQITEGLAAEQILELAESTGCQLIVMGTHGRTGLGRILAGSVAEEVLRHATCPVLTVRAPLAALADTVPEAKPVARV